MVNEKYYPHISLGTIIIAVILIIAGYIIATYLWRKYKSETFADHTAVLDATYKAPNSKTGLDFSDNLSYDIDNNLVVPAPNYDSTSWINNNVSDYAYLNEVDNPSTNINTQPSTPAHDIYPLTLPVDKKTQPIIQTQSDYYLLDDGDNGNLKLDYNRCSKSCCATNVWPVPFYSPDEEGIPGKDYVPTNMTCTNSISNGCLCATPAQITNLRTRGGNSPYFF